MEYFNDFIVDTLALRQNVQNTRNIVGEKVKICGIVKADAYGLSANIVCESIKDMVDYFAVANASEALKIRKIAKDKPILVLGVVPFDMLNECADNDIEISISGVSYLERLLRTECSNPIKAHIQVNTGLSRFGINNHETLLDMLNIIEVTNKKHKKVEIVGAYSHFATKANDKDFIETQHTKFAEILKDTSIPLLHISNSYATLNCPSTHHDMVRVGYSMYNMPNQVCSIYSKVVNVSHIKKGDSVGYDRTFIAPKDMDIAVVPMGYADGFDRRLSNNFSVYVLGVYCKVVGNVCMDVFMIDVSDIKCKFNDDVEILGNHITYDMYAKALNTSPYDIMLKFRYDRMNLIEIR